MKTSISKYWTFLFAFAMLFALSAAPAMAQSGMWDDEDEDEEVVEEEGPGKYDEATVFLNGEEVDLENTKGIDIKRGDTLNIQVRHLHPGSGVVIQAEKGGIRLKRKAFYANSRGELDLEVRIGKKKMKGTAVIFYQPSGLTKKRQREFKIVVD